MITEVPEGLISVVFLTEGIQKVLFSDSLSVGRLVKFDIPAPKIMAPFSDDTPPGEYEVRRLKREN